MSDIGSDEVLAALCSLRLEPVDYEQQIVQSIAEALTEHDIPYRHEVKLGPRKRIDFIAGNGIGIEVKKGKPNSKQVARQIARYCESDAIKELILVVERSVFHHITESYGKRVHYIALNRLWGIAL